VSKNTAMREEILINVTPHETRVAHVENGMLQEVAVERSQRRGLVGNIYAGRVCRVLPGMQAAFVDIGVSRTAFLHAADIVGTQDRPGDNGQQVAEEPPIDKLLTTGQELLVQVIKDPIGSKGARLTTQLCIPSRYLVLMPENRTVGISQRIEDNEERARLRQILLRNDPKLRAETSEQHDSSIHGFIIRTAAEGVGEEELCRDMEFLQRLWISVQNDIEHSSAPALIYEDLPLVIRTVRNLVMSEVEKIRIDSRETYTRVVDFARQFIPELLDRIEHYPGERPIFDLYSVEDEIQKALERKVELKSGGHLVIDQTEAMTTIDINTGAFVGHRNLSETIFKTNLEAAQAIARQLRLRNIGGIIIVDFIDMNDTEHQRQVLRALEKALERDRAKTTISEVTSLGLVQITRKRTRESLEQVLCNPCPICQGRGNIKSAETVCYEIFRELLREARQFEAREYLVIAAPSVVDMLHGEESDGVAELESFIGHTIRIQSESMYSPEQYDVVLL
jgi:ribonuclease G